MKKLIILITLCLLVHQVGRCQLLFRIDSISTHSVSELGIRSNQPLLGDTYEQIITWGPSVSIVGALINTSGSNIIIEKRTQEDKKIVRLRFSTRFYYKNTEFLTKQVNPWWWDYYHDSPSRFTIPNPDDGTVLYHGLMLKPGQSVKIRLNTHLFKDCYLCHTKSELWWSKNLKYNLRRGKRLEQILTEVIPTLEVIPQIEKTYETFR